MILEQAQNVLAVRRDEFHLTAVQNRYYAVSKHVRVRTRRSLGTREEIAASFGNMVRRVGKRRLPRVVNQDGIPTHVIGMNVRYQDVTHVGRFDPCGGQMIEELCL